MLGMAMLSMVGNSALGFRIGNVGHVCSVWGTPHGWIARLGSAEHMTSGLNETIRVHLANAGHSRIQMWGDGHYATTKVWAMTDQEMRKNFAGDKKFGDGERKEGEML